MQDDDDVLSEEDKHERVRENEEEEEEDEDEDMPLPPSAQDPSGPYYYDREAKAWLVREYTPSPPPKRPPVWVPAFKTLAQCYESFGVRDPRDREHVEIWFGGHKIEKEAEFQAVMLKLAEYQGEEEDRPRFKAKSRNARGDEMLSQHPRPWVFQRIETKEELFSNLGISEDEQRHFGVFVHNYIRIETQEEFDRYNNASSAPRFQVRALDAEGQKIVDRLKN